METLMKDRSEKLCLAKATMEELATLVTEAGGEAVKRFRWVGLPIARIENCQVVKTYPDSHKGYVERSMATFGALIGFGLS